MTKSTVLTVNSMKVCIQNSDAKLEELVEYLLESAVAEVVGADERKMESLNLFIFPSRSTSIVMDSASPRGSSQLILWRNFITAKVLPVTCSIVGMRNFFLIIAGGGKKLCYFTSNTGFDNLFKS